MNATELLNSNYVIGFVTVFGILFSSLIRPPIPESIIKLFDSKLIKIAVYAIIVWLLTQSVQVALIVAISFFILMDLIKETKIREGFINGMEEENLL